MNLAPRMTEAATGGVWSAILLSLRLAGTTVILLMLIATPLAWWLAHSHRRWKVFVEAIVALPLVLPPTVLGFYLLLAFAPQGFLGSAWLQLTGAPLAFTFEGLVIASVLYSLPFVVQPLQGSFEGNLASLAWMDEPTRAAALTKVQRMVSNNKIGYPDSWRDYTAVKTKAGAFFENLRLCLITLGRNRIIGCLFIWTF